MKAVRAVLGKFHTHTHTHAHSHIPSSSPQNGRLMGEKKKAVRAVLEKYGIPVTITAHQVRGGRWQLAGRGWGASW